MTNDKKVIELEDLIAETEQKIVNNEYYEDCQVEYRDAIIKVRIQPISQSRIVALSKDKSSLDNAEFNSKILQACILNKHNNERFTLEQINKLFTGGLAVSLTLKCLEVSGITLDKNQFNKLANF